MSGGGQSGNSNQALATPQVGNWYNTAWARRKLITVKPGQVTGTQLNFPMLVSLTSDGDLMASATATGQTSGNDILFTDSTGLALLPFEIESYSNGTLVAWVKVPSLADGSQVFLYYGNATATTLQNKTGVWDINHSLVMHYASSPALGSDSTIKGNNGTLSSNAPTATAGKIGAAVNFNNTAGAYCQVGSTVCQSIRNTTPQSWPTQGGPLTMEFWINNAIPASNWQFVFEAIDAGATYALNFQYADYMIWSREGGLQQAYTPAPTGVGSWHHVVYTTTNTGPTGRVFYVDGVAVGYITGNADASAAVASYNIGGLPNWYHPFVGSLDEFRVSTMARSAGWISTEYKNQSSPTTFYDVGSDLPGGGSVTVTGSSANLAPFASRPFSATVSGVPSPQPTTMRWSVVSVPASSSSNGLIDTGTNCVAAMNYRAPSTIRTAGNVVLKAESCYNSTWTSTISIPVAVATSVTVSIPAKPATVTGSYAFAATVANADGTGVSWSVAPAAAGTITAAGVYTAANGYSGNATVTATSVENTSIADSAPFSVVVAVSITLSSSGATQSVIASGTANFPINYSSTGTTGLVTFALLTPPAGANVNINPASVTNQGGASVTVSVSPGTSAAGTDAMTFRATNGTITQTLPLTLTVVDCGTITVSPSNVNVYPFQMANFTAVRTGAAANFGVTWSRDTAAGSFSSQLDPPAVQHPQISYFAADPGTQPQTVIVTAKTNNPASACSTFGGSATVTKQTYVPNGLSLLYTNPLSIVVPLNLSRFFDYGAASQNGAGSVRFVQLELRNNLGEVSDAATACAINFETTTLNNDPTAATSYAIAKVANNGAAGGSADNTAIAPRGGSASTQVIGTSSLWNCEVDGTGSDYVRSTNIFALHMKVKMKSLVFSPGTIHVYVRTYGSDPYEPAIRQYMGSFTTTN